MRTPPIFAVILVLAGACAGGEGQLRRVTAVDAVSRALDEADGHVQVRYNPAQCACAPFEIRTSEGWVRADFAEAEEEQALDALVARAESDGSRGVLAEYPVLASLVTATPSFCQNRVPYASLRLEKE
ncbi:MAG: hypothetical protein ABIK09_17680 [Pseudomonadota bacterium]